MHILVNIFLLEKLFCIWQTLYIRFRDIACQIFRSATEIVRPRCIGYSKYYITFSKYPGLTILHHTSKPWSSIINTQKSTKIGPNSPTISAFSLFHICIRYLRIKIFIGCPKWHILPLHDFPLTYRFFHPFLLLVNFSDYRAYKIRITYRDIQWYVYTMKVLGMLYTGKANPWNNWISLNKNPISISLPRAENATLAG